MALFQTQREKVVQAYQEASEPFLANTRPYESVQAITFRIEEADEGNSVAYAVADENQALEFFSYGIGDTVNLGPGRAQHRANESDTNMAKGKSTNGASDFIIEGVGLSLRGSRVAYSDQDAAITGTLAAGTDALAAALGQHPIIDPAAILAPPQVHSPFNLEAALFQALLPYMSLEFEFDRKRYEKLGAVDVLPQASAASYLRANGEPRADNCYKIPEGYLWRRDGQPDSEFVARVRLQDTVVAPINLITFHDAGPNVVTPTNLVLEVRMRVFGLSVDLPSQN